MKKINKDNKCKTYHYLKTLTTLKVSENIYHERKLLLAVCAKIIYKRKNSRKNFLPKLSV